MNAEKDKKKAEREKADKKEEENGLGIWDRRRQQKVKGD